MVDNILKVGQGLAALVLGGVYGGIGVVDGIDVIAPSAGNSRQYFFAVPPRKLVRRCACPLKGKIHIHRGIGP